jgi:hypothetical protein
MTPIDRRIAFLARAWARLTLVEAGEMDPEEAVVGLIESIDPHWAHPQHCRLLPV